MCLIGEVASLPAATYSAHVDYHSRQLDVASKRNKCYLQNDASSANGMVC